MSNEYELTFDVVEHEKVFEKSVSEILRQPPIAMVPSTEFHMTSTKIPNELKAAIYLLSRNYSNDSWLKTSRLIIEHGFTILMHKHNEKIKKIEELQFNILSSPFIKTDKISMYMVFEYNNSLTIGTEKTTKMSIRIQPKYANAIRKIAAIFNYKQFDITKICMVYSVLTSDEVPPYIKSELEKLLEEFENKMDVYIKSMENWKSLVQTTGVGNRTTNGGD